MLPEISRQRLHLRTLPRSRRCAGHAASSGAAALARRRNGRRPASAAAGPRRRHRATFCSSRRASAISSWTFCRSASRATGSSSPIAAMARAGCSSAAAAGAPATPLGRARGDEVRDHRVDEPHGAAAVEGRARHRARCGCEQRHARAGRRRRRAEVAAEDVAADRQEIVLERRRQHAVRLAHVHEAAGGDVPAKRRRAGWGSRGPPRPARSCDSRRRSRPGRGPRITSARLRIHRRRGRGGGADLLQHRAQDRPARGTSVIRVPLRRALVLVEPVVVAERDRVQKNLLLVHLVRRAGSEIEARRDPRPGPGASASPPPSGGPGCRRSAPRRNRRGAR